MNICSSEQEVGIVEYIKPGSREFYQFLCNSSRTLR